MKLANVETKVIAGATGAGLGSAVGTASLWGLGVLVWGAPSDAPHADAAVAAVPAPLAALIMLVLGVLGSLVAGYRAAHTSRPELATGPAASSNADAVGGAQEQQ